MCDEPPEMADNNLGFWASLGAAMPGFLLALAVKLLQDRKSRPAPSRRERDEDPDWIKARGNLDATQLEWFEGMRNDLKAKRTEIEEAEKKAELWERRARRIDKIAHLMWHNWANERMRTKYEGPDLPELPLLEDPL